MPYHLTDKEYVKLKGSRCPVCESTDIEGNGKTEIDGGDTVWIDVKCGFCKAEWSEHYTLSGYGLGDPYDDDEPEIIKTFESGMVSIVEIDGEKAVIIEAEKGRIWFTDDKSPRLKRIKDKQVRQEAIQALREIEITKKLTA